MDSKLGKVTIVDVAKACSVSVKTVSRVMNNSENVSPSTRNQVMRVAKELGYKTNILAKALKGNKTGVIMVLTDKHDDEHLSSWHTLMLKNIFRYARKHQLKVILAPSNANSFISDETDGYYFLENGLVDGVIFLEHVPDDPRCRFLKEKGIPFVLFGETNDESIWTVSLDNYQVGFKGATYLVQKGYKNIEFFLGDSKFNSNVERKKGFLDGVADAEGSFRVRTGVSTTDEAYRSAKDLIKKEKIDAFFVSGDERALGVYYAINEAGLKIPDDIAVLGIDNIPQGRYLYPRISTIDQDFEALAKECVTLLVNQISGADTGTRRNIKYLSSVIEREST